MPKPKIGLGQLLVTCKNVSEPGNKFLWISSVSIRWALTGITVNMYFPVAFASGQIQISIWAAFVPRIRKLWVTLCVTMSDQFGAPKKIVAGDEISSQS